MPDKRRKSLWGHPALWCHADGLFLGVRLQNQSGLSVSGRPVITPRRPSSALRPLRSARVANLTKTSLGWLNVTFWLLLVRKKVKENSCSQLKGFLNYRRCSLITAEQNQGWKHRLFYELPRLTIGSRFGLGHRTGYLALTPWLLDEKRIQTNVLVWTAYDSDVSDFF